MKIPRGMCTTTHSAKMSHCGVKPGDFRPEVAESSRVVSRTGLRDLAKGWLVETRGRESPARDPLVVHAQGVPTVSPSRMDVVAANSRPTEV